MHLSFHYLWEDDLDTASLEIATIVQSSMASSPLRTLRYGAIPPDEFLSWLTRGIRGDLEAQKKYPRIRWFDSKIGNPDAVRWEDIVIKDDDLESLVVSNGPAAELSRGRIVAHAAFMYHPPGGDATSAEGGHHGTDQEPNPLPLSGNRQLQEYFNAKVESALKAEFAGMHCLEIRELNVLAPDYWRKGIASRLLNWIIPKADKRNVPIVLAATPLGYPLYLKHGFVEVESENRIVECDMSEWGGTGIHRHVLMIRQPNPLNTGDARP